MTLEDEIKEEKLSIHKKISVIIATQRLEVDKTSEDIATEIMEAIRNHEGYI